jgi:transmembrane sensor
MGLLPIAAQDSQISVVLGDGSHLHLNAGSRVRVHFSRGERLLDLEAGQVLFDVAHDRSRPFRVRAGSADVIAVGTRFDVNRRAAAVTVTVVEGKVDVVDTVNASGSAGVTDHVPPLRVAAGERVEVGADGQPSATQPIDTHVATAWMRHDIAFSSKPLSDVTDELNRYLEKPIVIQDDGLRTLRISGIFNAYDAESFLAFLRQYDVEIDARDNVVYVRARPKPAPASTRATIAGTGGRGEGHTAAQ